MDETGSSVDRMKLTVVAVSTIIALPVAVVVGLFSDPANGSTSVSTVCVEDMECWDCATMGNLVCGTLDRDYPIEGIESDTGEFVGGYN